MQSNSRFVRRALYVSVAAGLLVAGTRATPTTSANDGEDARFCSERTLRGDYGFAVEGTLFTGPAAGGLFRGVAMTHYDGRGNLTQVDFPTINGVPVDGGWRSSTGTYEIDANCTGSAVIAPDDGTPPRHQHLVVVDGGRQVMTVVEGNAVGSTGIRVR